MNSLVQTPRNDNPPSGNRLRECLQRFETLDKDIQFTKVCGDASFWRRVLRADSDSSIHATNLGQTIIGPVLQIRIIQYLGINGIDIQIRFTTSQERTSWVVICRWKNRHVEELHLNDPDHTPTSSEFARVGHVAKRVQSALCTRMRIVFHAIRLELKTSVCREVCHCHVYCTRL